MMVSFAGSVLLLVQLLFSDCLILLFIIYYIVRLFLLVPVWQKLKKSFWREMIFDSTGTVQFN